MARALRSSGASASASTSPATTNGTATRARLKRKRTADDDQQQGSPKHAPRRDDDDDSASPLTDLAPSPAVKHELDEGTPNGDLNTPNTTHTPLPDAPQTPKENTRSPTPYAFTDRCDVPLDPQDTHKLLTVLEMLVHALLCRHPLTVLCIGSTPKVCSRATFRPAIFPFALCSRTPPARFARFAYVNNTRSRLPLISCVVGCGCLTYSPPNALTR